MNSQRKESTVESVKGKNCSSRMMGESGRDGEDVEKGRRQTVWWEERVRVVKWSLMFISLLRVGRLLRRVAVCGGPLSCELFEWLFSAVCTRKLKGLSQQRSLWVRKWLTSVWSLRFLAVWTAVDSRRVAGAGVKTRLAAEEDESGSGDVNKSKSWRGISNLLLSASV